ncbi:minor capsid protein [Capybara microvirus Cap3_SP_470]|nr:minor capsid protein [Capybara microvirus Cap3_SP_470]
MIKRAAWFDLAFNDGPVFDSFREDIAIDVGFSPSGESIVELYDYVVDEYGIDCIKKRGRKKNIQEEIQSYRDSCDIHHIIAQFSLGDMTVINRGNPMYGDFSDLPNTFIGLHDLMSQATDQWINLPSDIKAAFDNNQRQWLASIDNGSYESVVAPIIAARIGSSDQISSEVTSDEQKHE